MTNSRGGRRSHEVVVLGSGAAGLTAALAAAAGGADVGLYEKADVLGGTTAISGGIVWVPGNHLMEEIDGIDVAERDADPAEALRYLRALAGDALDGPVAETLVTTGPEMLRFVESSSPCRFRLLAGYPDYHADVPGSRPGGGRSLEPELFDLSVLGEWAGRLCFWDGGARPVMLSETSFGGATESPPAPVISERRERGVCGMGEALTGSLLAGCLDAGVTVRTGARARRLATDDGRVTGVRFDALAGEGTTGEVTVEARSGVILATGGFEWNEALVRSFLRGPMDAPAGVPTNTGDGLDMAIHAGAALGNMAQAWWAPMVQVPGEEAWGAPRYHLVLVERTRPGSIMVNAAGERFCNEAANYNSLGEAFHSLGRGMPGSATPDQSDSDVAVWLVCDDRYRRRYPLPGCRPGAEPPPWVHRGDTLADLAARLGVPPAALDATVTEFNRHAAAGADPVFGRGASVYDHFNGDRSLAGAAATLGTVDEPPFYAVAIRIGALGTSGGPRTDVRGRVLSREGETIPGLWAAGNVMAAPTATVYGGAGGTLGPAMTFGYLAGREAAG
ncbi:MAG: FAD-dependent oxidoreductase [Acidimicrobiia bacterium]|nr:FAD-dependent oxidoreductase [Acidimicrobiia bacterium]